MNVAKQVFKDIISSLKEQKVITVIYIEGKNMRKEYEERI